MLCFRKFTVAKKFMDKRGGGGKYQNFPSKVFCLTVPKNFVGEPFCVINFGCRKTLCFRGLCHDFSSNFFVSQCRKIP